MGFPTERREGQKSRSSLRLAQGRLWVSLMYSLSCRRAVAAACVLTAEFEFRQSLVANTDETEKAAWLLLESLF